MTLNLRELEEAGRQAEQERSKLQDLLEKRGHVFFQQRECEIVLEEFEFLNETDVVMKQTGPTLVRQELSEAKDKAKEMTEFLGEQLRNLETAIEAHQKVQVAADRKLQQMQAQVK